MPVKTWVGRFAIVGGEAQEEGPLLHSYPRQRPDEEEDELYVLVEPAGEGSAEYAGQLVEAIGRMYGQDTLSITGAVLRSMQAANQQLRDWNERSLPEHRVLAGVSCLAVREHAAYLAQAGPSVAYHVGGGRFQRIAPEGQAAVPLGQSELAEPSFTRYELAPGDLLLVASPQLDDLIDEEGLRPLLLRGGDDALVELFRIAKDQQDFSLVLLACVVEAEETAPEAGVLAPPPAEPGAAAGIAPGPPEPVPPVEAPLAPSAEPELLEPEPAAVAPGPAPEAPAFEEGVLEEPPLTTRSTSLRDPGVRLRGPESDIRYRRPSGLGASIPNIPPIAILIAIVVAIAAVAAVCYLPDELRNDRQDQFASSIETARTALDNAANATDAGDKRAFLDQAAAALQDAASRQPDSSEVADLQAELDRQEAELNAELELTDLQLVVDVSERIPGAVSPKDLVIGGGGAYFLDREAGRVIAVSLLAANPDPFVLMESGALVGDLIAGEPRHIAWAEDLNALLVLDDQRNLFAITPPEAPRLLTVRGSDAWGSVDGIAYQNGLYVLDRAGDQVWFYPTVDGGFDSERVPQLDATDLQDVVEMSVGDELYLIMTGDTILRFPQTVARPFPQDGIDTPLSSPASLVPLQSEAAVLVADRGNSRIVEFTPDGTFIQQFVSATFTDLRAIAADETNKLLYVLVGGSLYRTDLPGLPPANQGGQPTPTGGTAVPSGTDEVLTYQVVQREDVSVGDVVRIVFRVTVSSEPTEAELAEIANQLIDDETAQHDVNALGFFFYLPDTDTNGPYTAGTGDWSPNGQWDAAGTVAAGDYSTHQLTIAAGSILPP